MGSPKRGLLSPTRAPENQFQHNGRRTALPKQATMKVYAGYMFTVRSPPATFLAVSTRPTNSADVLIIGTGLIGLACANAAAARGLSVLLVGQSRPGAASLAAAGLLAPSIEREDGHAGDFATTARDRYPTYIDWLRDATGIDVPLNRDGIVQVALNEAGVRGLRRSMSEHAEWLEHDALVELEPALAHALGGVLNPTDGCVDNVRLFEALEIVVTRNASIARADDTVIRIELTPSAVNVVGTSGTTFAAEKVVLAAGAWTATIAGLPRPIPVEPVRGQMIAYSGSPLRRAVYGPTGYLVPRPTGRTLVGATTERVGFESTTTPEGYERLRRTAAEVLPTLTGVQPIDSWAGLRPMSADLQPILGSDPDEHRLIYATGHSRNGILMTPLTGDCVAALLVGEAPPANIEPFSIARFRSSS